MKWNLEGEKRHNVSVAQMRKSSDVTVRDTGFGNHRVSLETNGNHVPISPIPEQRGVRTRVK